MAFVLERPRDCGDFPEEIIATEDTIMVSLVTGERIKMGELWARYDESKKVAVVQQFGAPAVQAAMAADASPELDLELLENVA